MGNPQEAQNEYSAHENFRQVKPILPKGKTTPTQETLLI